MSRRDQLRARRAGRYADRPPPSSRPLETPPPVQDVQDRVPGVLDGPLPDVLRLPGTSAVEPRDAAEGIHPTHMPVVRTLIGAMNGPQLAVVIALAFTRARELDLTLSAPMGLPDVPTWRLLNGRTEVVGRVWWENGEWRTW